MYTSIDFGDIKGYQYFCEKNSGESICKTKFPHGRNFIREDEVPIIEDVNSRVNNAMNYITDVEQYKEEDVWVKFTLKMGNYPYQYSQEKTQTEQTLHETKFQGDCEDNVLTKYGELDKRGIPIQAMKLVFITYQGESQGHLLLAIRKESGTYLVLNNGKNSRPIEIDNLITGIKNTHDFHYGKKITKILVTSDVAPYKMQYPEFLETFYKINTATSSK